jgi:hypothetical protein
MKKLFLLSFAALLLSGCADKANYEAAVLTELERDAKTADAKEYKLPLDKLAACIVATSAQGMPGLFELDPARLTAYRHYTKMLTLPQSADPKKTMEELRQDFGSPQQLTAARSNYIESHMECMATFINGDDPKPMELN